MDKAMFDELFASVQEMDEITKGNTESRVKRANRSEYIANKQLAPKPKRQDYDTYTEYLLALNEWNMRH